VALKLLKDELENALGICEKSQGLRWSNGRLGDPPAVEPGVYLKPRHERTLMYNEEIAKAILEYLRDQPGSGDTVEGISKWWIMSQRIKESIEVVRVVLEELGRKGLIYERSTADGSIVYFARKPPELE
jgi:hypothetical protein